MHITLCRPTCILSIHPFSGKKTQVHCALRRRPSLADRNPKPEHSSSTRTTGKNHHADPKTRTRADASSVTPPATDAEHELSAREIEVLRLVTKGLINKEIADKLHISLTTVISHRKNITEKLGIKSVSGLAIYAVMHGYIDADRI